jgi:hypothetical protein
MRVGSGEQRESFLLFSSLRSPHLLVARRIYGKNSKIAAYNAALKSKILFF